MRIACWKTKATSTRREYGILIALPLQMWLGERVYMLRLYVHCLSCYYRHIVCLLRGTDSACCDVGTTEATLTVKHRMNVSLTLWRRFFFFNF